MLGVGRAQSDAHHNMVRGFDLICGQWMIMEDSRQETERQWMERHVGRVRGGNSGTGVRRQLAQAIHGETQT